MRQLLVILTVWFLASVAVAQPVPPAPQGFVVDEAKVLSPGAVTALNTQLLGVKDQSSTRIVVAMYPAMGAESGPITARGRELFTAWGVGRDGGNMGVLLLVYVADRKINITVSDGLRDKLPNDTCQRIIDQDIAPRFRAGDYDRGIDAGVSAIMYALNSRSPAPPPSYAERSFVSQIEDSQSLAGWLIGLAITFLLFCSIVEMIYKQRYLDGTAPLWAMPFIVIAKGITFILSLIPSRHGYSYGRSGSSYSSWSRSGGGFFGSGGGRSWGGGGFSGGGSRGGGGCSSGGGASGSW
jgi:uncharacterized protein